MTEEERLKARRDLMKGIMSQSKAGTFDPSMREMAQEQAAELGVSKEDFGSALQRYGVESPTPATTTPTAPSSNMTEEERLKARRDLMKGIMSQSKAGAFDPSMREMAQERAAELGVSKEDFGSALQRYGVESPTPATTTPTAPSSQDASLKATQDVMFKQQFGSGLDALEAMQSPNYELGSGSSLRQPARRLGTLSGDMRRAARRLRRQGYTGEAAKMAGQAEMQRLTESPITSQADRGSAMAMDIKQGEMAMKDEAQQRRMMDLSEQLLRKRLQEPY